MCYLRSPVQISPEIQAYYSGSGGTGTQYTPGQSITATGTYHAYDSNGGCSAEETFTVTIIPAQILDLESTCLNTQIPSGPLTGINECAGTFQSEAWYSVSLTEAKDLDVTLNAEFGGALPTISIYNGNLEASNHVGCYNQGNQVISLPPGEYCFQFLDPSLPLGPGSFCIFAENATCTSPPQIDPHPNNTVCGSYILPPITGINLSGNEAYYTGSGGTGLSYQSGQIISATIFLFIYDTDGECSDEKSFNVTITSTETVTKIYGNPPGSTQWESPSWWSTFSLPEKCDHVIIPTSNQFEPRCEVLTFGECRRCKWT